MKYAAGITLYNPTKSQISHIKEYSNSFDLVILYDNSEPDYEKPSYDIIGNKFRILTQNENKGLPFAFNAIIDECDAFDYLCTLDQDSTFSEEDIKSMKDYIETISNQRNIGIIAPFIDYGFGSHEKNQNLEIRKWVITSGSFVNLDVLRKENIRYDNAYFIDKFEIDLCEQLRRRGYVVAMYHNSVLHQELGEASGHRHPNHNSLRHYYLFRNRFYFNSKWYTGLYKSFLNVAQTIKHVCLITLYEDRKVEKIKQLYIAYRHYRRKKMFRMSSD